MNDFPMMDDMGYDQLAQGPEPLEDQTENGIPGFKTDEELRQFVIYASHAKQAWSEGIGGFLTERWKTLRGMYNLDGSNQQIQLEKEAPHQMPVLRSKGNQLVASVCGPAFSSEPYFVARSYGSTSRAEEVEQTVHYLLKTAGADRHARKACRQAYLSEPCFLKVVFTLDSQDETSITTGTGINIHVIQPDNMMVYPATSGGIMDAILVGNRMLVPKAVIQEQISAKLWRNVDLKGASNATQDQGVTDHDSPTHVPSVRVEDDTLELWDLLYQRLDSDNVRRWYRLIVHFETLSVLYVSKFGVEYQDDLGQVQFTPYDRPWYFEVRLQEPEGDELYSRTPIAHSVQGINLTIDALMHLCIEGSMHTAMPPVLTDTSAFGSEAKKYDAGHIYKVPSLGKFEVVPSTFNMGAMPAMIEKLELYADSVTNVSRAAAGQALAGVDSATEASGILAGQQTGLDEYRANFMQAWVQVCDFVRHLCYLYYEPLKRLHGPSLPCNDREMLAKPCVWEPFGKSPASDPRGTVEKVRVLSEYAKTNGLNVNPVELFKVLLAAVDIGVDTSKIFNEDNPFIPPPGPLIDPTSPIGGQGPQGPIGEQGMADISTMLGIPGA